MAELKFIRYGDGNTISDYEGIRKTAFEENIANNIIIGINLRPSYDLYLIYKNGDVIGFGGYKREKFDLLNHNFSIQNLYVKKSLQGQGIMGKLYDFLEDQIKNSGCNVIRIESVVVETNQPSIKFFEKHGFKEFGASKERIYDKKNNKYVGTKYFEKIINL